MCYGSSRNFIVNEHVGGNKTCVSSNVVTNVDINFTIPVTVMQEKPSRYYAGKVVPAEMRGFLIESASFSLNTLFDEDLLTNSDSDLKEWLNRSVTVHGRWILKSGGAAKEVEARNINIAELPANIVQVIHQAVALGLDKMYNEVNRMYDNYSKFINESYNIKNGVTP